MSWDLKEFMGLELLSDLGLGMVLATALVGALLVHSLVEQLRDDE